MATLHLRMQDYIPQSGYGIIASREYLVRPWRAHDHDFTEIVIILGGRGIQITADRIYRLNAGDVFILQPGAWHDFANCEALEVINFGIDKGLMNSCLAEVVLESKVNWLLTDGPHFHAGVLHLSLPQGCQEKVASLGLSIIEAGRLRHSVPTGEVFAVMDDEDAYCDYQTQVAYLRLLLLELGRTVRPPGTEIHPRILQVISAMERDLHRSWRVESLAAIACMEPTYFVRRFRQEMNVTPVEYLMRRRVERAALHLMSPGNSIQQTAFDFGFHDASHFIRRFKRYFGQTPREYRKQIGFQPV